MTSRPPPPVVFIHGWKASVLADERTGSTEFDYTLGMALGLARDPSIELPLEWDNDGNQVKDNLVAVEPCHSASCCGGTMKIQNIYGPLLDHLQKTRDLHAFAYDWRLCLDETVDDFEKFLEGVRDVTGRYPQVVAHSMGGLITLSLLNKRPGIFHSILFGAGALSPNASIIKDYSLVAGKNTVVKNTTCFSPKINLSNPSALHFLSYPGERELYGKPNCVLTRDEEDKPVELNMHDIEAWKKLKIGVYHPDSGVKQSNERMEAWFQSVLEKVHKFRKGLLPANSGLKPSHCPPVAVLRGDHVDTEFCYVVRADGLDLRNDIRCLRGDGRVTLEDALPPRDVPVNKVVTNDREHSDVLNDIENVNALLEFLILEKG